MVKGSIYNQEFYEAYDDKKNGFDITTIHSIIENSFGESNELDFKEKFIKEDKLAKIIIAMGNSGGGTVIFGINDDGKPVGVPDSEIKDPTDFQRKINSYIPSNLIYNTQSIVYKENELYGEFSGKTFYVFYIPKQYRYVPFLANKNSETIKTNEVYIRKNTSTETATNEDLESLFQFRLREQYEDLSSLDLNEHLEQLKILYQNIEKTKTYSTNLTRLFASVGTLLTSEVKDNPHYPEETYDEFIAKMIIKKKHKIEIVLEVTNIE